MVIYRNNCTDPYFNLAAEQYLLDTKQGESFMLWRNSDAVIIGKNQNAYAELNLDFVEKNGIKVVRRLTGGGAVFHDLGNVNFSFIVPAGENATLDFARFTAPVIEALEALGVENVSLSGRNDIMICDSKISGNAQSSYNGKTLHHGTLLFSSNLTSLAGALRVDPEKIRSKGIKSVRNRVGNISEHLKTRMSAEEFMAYLEEYIAKRTGAAIVELSAEDKKNIQRLADEKYSTWDWNFGRSKEFVTEKSKRYPFGGVRVSISAENGTISRAMISGDFFGVEDVSLVEAALVGARYDREALTRRIDPDLLGRCIAGMDVDTFLDLLLE